MNVVFVKAELPKVCHGHVLPADVLEKHRLYRIGVAGPDKNLEQQMLDDSDSSESDNEEEDDADEDEEGEDAPISFAADGKPVRRPSDRIT